MEFQYGSDTSWSAGAIFWNNSIYGAIEIAGGDWGFLNTNGKLVCKPKYSSVSDFENNLAIVSYNGKHGIINSKLDTIIPIKFDYLIDTDNKRENFFTGIQNQHFGYLSSNHHHIPFIYKRAWSFKNGMGIVSKNKLLNIINFQGDTLLEKEYQKIEILGNGYVTFLENGKWGLCNENGKILLPANFQFISTPVDTIVRVKQNNLFGFISTNNKWIIPLKYENASDFSNGYSIIRDHNLYIVIDIKGKKIFQGEYQKLTALNNSTNFIYSEKGMDGILNKEGKVVLNNTYSSLKELENGQLIFMKNKSCGIISNAGKVILELPYKKLFSKEGINTFKVFSKNKYFYCDSLGKVIGKMNDWLSISNNGYSIARNKELATILKIPSKEIITLKGNIEAMSDSKFFLVKVQEGYNVVDTNGYYLFDEPLLDKPINLSGNIFAIRLDNDKNSQYAITNPYTEQLRKEYIFKELGPKKEECNYAQLKYKLGVINKDGRKLLGNEFYSIKKIDEDIFEILDANRNGYLVNKNNDIKFINYYY